MDRLPASVSDPFVATLVHSLAEPELRRALAEATRCLLAEITHSDPARSVRLTPLLQEFGATREAEKP
jgi:hypothetical protein